MSARRRLAQLGLLGLLLAIAILGAGYSAFERAVTARIAAIETPATGVEVRDRDGALLRAFANDDGRWRLAAGAGDVDPRYLEMLVAWEDKRFAEHGGVERAGQPPEALGEILARVLRRFGVEIEGNEMRRRGEVLQVLVGDQRGVRAIARCRHPAFVHQEHVDIRPVDLGLRHRGLDV